MKSPFERGLIDEEDYRTQKATVLLLLSGGDYSPVTPIFGAGVSRDIDPGLANGMLIGPPDRRYRL